MKKQKVETPVVIKASLSKSTEGKQVLDMIQAVGNIKMLQ